MSDAKLQALKVTELKSLLQAALLPTSGNKADLIQRLKDNPSALASLGGDEAPAEAPAEAAAPESAAAAPQEEEEEEDLLAEDPAPAAAAPAPAPAGASAQAPSSSTHVPAESTAPSAEERKATLIAELEKRKARAARFGQPTDDIDAKLERARKFGIDVEDKAQESSFRGLEQGLKAGSGRKEEKDGAANGKSNGAGEKREKPAKVEETEEQKAAREAREKEEEEKRRKRAERFGIPAPAPAAAPAGAANQGNGEGAKEVDPAEEERKRKRAEKFGGAAAAEPAEKKVKA